MKSKFIFILLAFTMLPVSSYAGIAVCDDTFRGEDSEVKFRRTYPKPVQIKPSDRRIIQERKQKPHASAERTNNEVIITYQDFLDHLGSNFTRRIQRIILPDGESFSMDVKDIDEFGIDPQTWVMPDLSSHPNNEFFNNIEQFDGSESEHRDNFPVTTGGGLTYTQHGLYGPSVNIYDFYEIQYDEQEDLGGLVWLGLVDNNNNQVQEIGSELVPVPADWGRSSTLYYTENSDDPNVDYIDVEQHVEIVAFGTLTTYDDGDVEGVKVHSTTTLTTYYVDNSTPTETIEREIWWYSKEGHYLRGRLTENAPFTGQTSFQAMVYHKISPATLPVTWVDFTAQVNEQQQVKLTWRTASEQDNSHFIIQKSTDGRTFSKIGEQASKGNSTTMQAYTFTDEKPATGINYYRIQQVDFNGKSTYSEVITAMITDEATATPTVVLYPNPGKNEVWFSQTADYELYDAKGILLTSGRADDVADVSALPAGTYFVRINGGKMLSWVKN